MVYGRNQIHMFINENACGGVWCGVIMVEVAQGLMGELDARFLEQSVLHAMGIVYP